MTSDRLTERLIVTAASAEYGSSLLALLGSLNLNWSGHPPVLVYDLGLDAETRAALRQHGVPVREVPAFCTHWRQHFTWKIWALADAPARDILWMDAGLVVLQPLDEVFASIDGMGYFFTTNQELLDWEASEAACRGCGVPAAFRLGKPTLPGGMMGFRKTGKAGLVIEEALAAALVEERIAATDVAHRHDQALISLLAYKHFGSLLVADGAMYLGSLSPEQVPGQKVWVHRRRMRSADVAHLAAHLTAAPAAAAYRPTPPCTLARARALAEVYRIYWCFGRGEQALAAGHMRAAFAFEPELLDELPAFARVLQGHARRLARVAGDPQAPARYLAWVVSTFAALAGPDHAHALGAHLSAERESGLRPAS